jgi:peptidoglycan hydrolase-like protein with peptidoglycan-binding domain
MARRGMVVGAIGSVVIVMLVSATWLPRCGAAEVITAAEPVEATPSLIREMQFMLMRLGLDPGPIDGIVGPQTTRALRKFEEQFGLPVEALANGGRVSVTLLSRLRDEASRAIFGGEEKSAIPPGAPAAATPPAAAAVSAQPPDRFSACPFSPEDFRIGDTQYTPDKYLQVGFEGSTARAVSMLRDRLNEARQIAENIGGSALIEVQRQSRVLNYYSCRLKVEQSSENKN